MNHETESEYLGVMSQYNAEYWTDKKYDNVHQRLITKYGSREKAMKVTFTLLWNGFKLAVNSLPQA